MLSSSRHPAAAVRWWVAALALIASLVLPTATAAADCAGGDCDMQSRIAAANAYLADRPGSVGFVLRDRKTGVVYRNSHAGQLVWTASTIKLAVVVDLATRNRAGTISLTDADGKLIAAMLNSSDSDATDTLWSRYGGPDHQIFNADFPAYGMTQLQPQRGFSDIYPYWGFQKTTPEDLDRLVNYALTRMHPADTAGIVNALQHVAPNQQWGVWGAGPGMAPGNKNGWSQEQGGWVVNSVGFAGPGQRYTLAIMNALGGQGGYDDGVETTTHLSRQLLAGRG